MSRRRTYPGIGPSQWHITVASADNSAVLWHGATADLSEIKALATEARRLRPEALIWIRAPSGRVSSWD
jgi:hypothetical protein